MIYAVNKFILNKRMMFLLMVLLSALSLITAFIAQYGFNLQPCNLCVIQRWPFVIIIVLGLIGFFLSNNNKIAIGAMLLIGITFLSNSIIAFYHSGVERKWWKSFLEGCNVPKMEGSAEEILARIQSITEAVRCDEIPWADPIFGLSMANYNVIFCLGLGLIAFYCAYKILKSPIKHASQ